MIDRPAKPPRAFMSYSWSSAEHQSSVLQLATDLREHGVDVVLDVWDLKEGDDKYAFMERMVTDPSVDKVIVVSDSVYAAKADDREGGVGTETQIISKEVYERALGEEESQKVVVVVMEHDEDGEPCVPTYFQSRIHIDMTDPDDLEERFEQLVRWIHNKPLHMKPPIGTPPSYLYDEPPLNIGTATRARRAASLLKQQEHNALVVAQDFFETFATNLGELRLESEPRSDLDERVTESIKQTSGIRDEVVDVVQAMSRHALTEEAEDILWTFFEQLLPLGHPPHGTSSWSEGTFDNLRFLSLELFLYTAASLLKRQRFGTLNNLLARGFYCSPGILGLQEGLSSYTCVDQGFKSIGRTNQRRSPPCLDPIGTLIKERATRIDIRFDDLMQADFVLYLRGLVDGDAWHPHTLVYTSGMNHRRSPFEIFARSESRTYFDRMKVVIAVPDRDTLAQLIENERSNPVHLPSWRGATIDLSVLTGLERLASRP